MLELRISLDGVDYDTLIPKIIPFIIKNPLAAKAVLSAYKIKTHNMTQSEKDAFAAQLLNDNRNKIIDKLQLKLSDNGIKDSKIQFEADAK